MSTEIRQTTKGPRVPKAPQSKPNDLIIYIIIYYYYVVYHSNWALVANWSIGLQTEQHAPGGGGGLRWYEAVHIREPKPRGTFLTIRRVTRVTCLG